MTLLFSFFTLLGGFFSLFVLAMVFVVMAKHAQTSSKSSAMTPKPMVRALPNDVFVPRVKAFLDEGISSVTFKVRGVSMRPFLEHERDCVVIAKAQEISVGDVVLAEVGEKHYVLHRVLIRQEDDLVLKGDGNVKGIETCTTAQVIGKAVAFYRKGRKRADTVDGLKWRCYSWFWMHTIPLRRYFLAAHRRIWLRLFPVDLSREEYNYNEKIPVQI